jgi:putative SOS response-associated peptidase YedK
LLTEKAEYFFMAGIWNPFTDKETGEAFNCFAIVTTAANPIMQQIHNNKKRMPLILPEPYAWQWLMEDLNETEIKEIISIKIESIALKAHTISKDLKLHFNLWQNMNMKNYRL